MTQYANCSEESTRERVQKTTNLSKYVPIEETKGRLGVRTRRDGQVNLENQGQVERAQVQSILI